IIVDMPPAPQKKEINNSTLVSTKTENMYDKDNNQNNYEQSNEKKEEKTLYSTNNKESIKEEINKIKKMLR
ncbi:hypothetical protein GQ473_01715, partial [archaeon]|nr:hypothetical protein [archaeon]